MNVAVNGATRAIPPGTSLVEVLVEVVGERTEGVAIALNGEVVRRAAWPSVQLADGDVVEIVQARQGG
ncbi:MAG: sulfur carrier protein ThiS [Dehalococcoidia bacterium]|nr:sulfur carrier protein ThiS [Dehalococcoidia bacterium]